MNRINDLFAQKRSDILSIYFCAGAPTLDGTVNVIRTLEQKGVNMIGPAQRHDAPPPV
jgi:tryptophan synthase alpha chain